MTKTARERAEQALQIEGLEYAAFTIPDYESWRGATAKDGDFSLLIAEMLLHRQGGPVTFLILPPINTMRKLAGYDRCSECGMPKVTEEEATQDIFEHICLCPWEAQYAALPGHSACGCGPSALLLMDNPHGNNLRELHEYRKAEMKKMKDGDNQAAE